MMIFGTAPRSNTKAATSSWSAKDTATVAIAGGVLVTIGVVGGVIAYFEKKAWQNELADRELLIETANRYIKELAKNLKRVIPRSHSYLFKSLVKCQNRYDLLSWQGTIPSSIGIKNLEQIKSCLYSHWIICEPANLYANLHMLDEMYANLLDDKKFQENIRIEEKKIEAKKNQQKIINQVNNTHIDNSRTNINNNTFDYSNNYNTNYNTSNQYDNNYNTNYNNNHNANYNYNNGHYGNGY